MGAVIDDLYDHEGFSARRLPDGTLTDSWTQATAKFDAYVAGCDCGWRGEEERPPSDAGYEIALDDWERDHARPLLARTVPGRVTRMIGDLKAEIGVLAKERPAAAQQALSEVRAWTDAMMALARGTNQPTSRCGRPLRR